MSKHSFQQILLPLLISVTIGALAGFGAVAFRWLIGWAQNMLWPVGADFLHQYSRAPWWLQVGIPAGAGLILGPLLLYLAPEARGTGVPEVTVREDQNLEDAFHIFASRHFSFLPVVARNAPDTVVGYLKEGDLLTTYDQHILSEQMKPSARWICKLPNRRT